MMKKKRKKIIIIGSILLTIALLVSFSFAWNAGLGLPKGFKHTYGKTEYKPFYVYTDSNNRGSYSSNYRIVWGDSWCFSFQYSNYDNKTYFSYSDDKNYYEKHDKRGYIYKTADDSIVGSLFLNQDKWRNNYSFYNQTYNSYFIDENFLYYVSRTSINRFYFAIPTHWPQETNYSRYEFFRFNLDDGQNEKISPEQYIEQINKYDETILLNKKLRIT